MNLKLRLQRLSSVAEAAATARKVLVDVTWREAQGTTTVAALVAVGRWPIVSSRAEASQVFHEHLLINDHRFAHRVTFPLFVQWSVAVMVPV